MEKLINKIKIKHMEPLPELANFSKYAAGEGIVLLKNEGHVLPIQNKKVAVFGRIQFNYYKSGTGSGGLVNVRYVPSIIEALLSEPSIEVNKKVYEVYKDWVREYPFDSGNGQWASEPWFQQEMLIDEKLVQASALESEIGLIIFGRTAGEDKDNQARPGSYYLTDEERHLLKLVTKHFKKTVVVLNIGNAMDLSFMDEFNIQGLVAAWHGGQYGAVALKDILVGYKSPSGKLPFSFIKNIDDDPSHKNFGHHSKAIYEEDIYVGYRYFETFKPDAVRYPFGFGLTYSNFDIEPIRFDMKDKIILFNIKVTNIGDFRAKEVIQIYVEAPQGLLGKPKKVLAAFAKTKELAPSESAQVQIEIDLYNLASYDDIGHVYKSSFVLEKGLYQFYVGNSSRQLTPFGQIQMEDDIITELSRELNAPIEPFKRIKPDKNLNVIYEETPLRTTNYNEIINSNIPEEIPTNNLDLKLVDVHENKVDLDTFVGSLHVDQLIELTRGEGMSSPKVTAGTAAAFGGVTDELMDKGIPIACAADGPSGIRMDSGFYASSMPNGISLASTFDLNLVQTLYTLLGKEMKGYEIDMILGPGMNIIRHPLNGRNFEYYSEDPLLTGLMASSAIIGLQKEGVTGTLKHLYANNQETDRFNVDAVVSERAQREIYLRPFEIAIKVGKARAIMTSYNPVNSLWTASQFEINTLLVRETWGFDGIIVTDWWAKMNDFGTTGDVKNTKAMILSQNDLYMVITDSKTNSNNDNSKASFEDGSLKLAHLQRVAKNILSFLLTTPAFYRMHNLKFKPHYRKPKAWFKTNQKPINLPLLKDLNINGQDLFINPLLFNIYLNDVDKINSINTKNKATNIYYSDKQAVVQMMDENDTNIYNISTINLDTKEDDLVDLTTLKNLDYPKVGSKVWEPVVINFDDMIYDRAQIKHLDDTLVVLAKDSLLSYGLEFMEAGKYVIDFELSSESSTLAQLPFSMYLNNVYKRTLTVHGTEGQKISARASILVDQGQQVLTIRFNKSDMKLFNVKIMRHG